jgi:23S rRNA pseudouridine1911/1915/1917 synthase
MVDFNIDSQFNQLKIREFLSTFHLSKSKIYNFELHKSALLNHTYKGLDACLQTKDVLSLDFIGFHANPIIPFEGDIKVIYEDDDILILNKQAFILVHTDGNTNDTLTNRIAFHYETDYPILPVHRIDFETSGLLVFAKHPLSHAFLSRLFEQRKVEKTYLAYVNGVVEKDEGWIKEPIGKDRHKNRQRVTKDGQDAQTYYKVIKRFKNQSLLEVNIIGGRKHQIRVHLAYINHPVINDELYGVKKNEGQGLKLHFKHVKFIHPRSRALFEIDTNQSV